MALDPLTQLGTTALPSGGSESGIDAYAAPAVGLDGSSDGPLHTLLRGSMGVAIAYGTGTTLAKLPPKLDLGRFPSHRSQWERWTWNLHDKLNAVAPRVNGDALVMYIVFCPGEVGETILSLFNRFYANPCFFLYMKHINAMLVNSLRFM